MDSLVNFSPLLGAVGLVFALALYVSVVRAEQGNERMREIAEAIQSGAMAFLRREYSILVIFVVVVALLLVWARRAAAAAFRQG